jgi:hypothetical protein
LLLLSGARTLARDGGADPLPPLPLDDTALGVGAANATAAAIAISSSVVDSKSRVI